MCISDRLKEVLVVKNMSIREFSEVTEISYRSVMNYLNEGRDPNVDGLVKIHGALGISITWLLTGKGNMFQFEHEGSNISENEKILLSSYRMMSSHVRDAFNILFKEFLHKS